MKKSGNPASARRAVARLACQREVTWRRSSHRYSMSRSAPHNRSSRKRCNRHRVCNRQWVQAIPLMARSYPVRGYRHTGATPRPHGWRIDGGRACRRSQPVGLCLPLDRFGRKVRTGATPDQQVLRRSDIRAAGLAHDSSTFGHLFRRLNVRHVVPATTRRMSSRSHSDQEDGRKGSASASDLPVQHILGHPDGLQSGTNHRTPVDVRRTMLSWNRCLIDIYG